MVTIRKLFGDGTSQGATITYNGNSGTETLAIYVDVNTTLNNRSVIFYFRPTIASSIVRTLAIKQKPRSREFSIDFNNDFK